MDGYSLISNVVLDIDLSKKVGLISNTNLVAIGIAGADPPPSIGFYDSCQDAPR